ncbi:MAG: hypothetical protein E6J91_50515 [Deltaproteobacteria bacterium]|nr:MAG: hypothetical protein E6J91_50515 [Deltaproteobacteria bacterium]
MRAATRAALAGIIAFGVVAGGLVGCGSTGGSVVAFDVAAAGVPGASLIEAAAGWHVTLSRATLHIGAVYLNLAVPISGSQETSCILPGIYTAQELSGLDVDTLSTALQPFPAPATGTDDEARTGEIWLTGGDVNADSDSTVIADIAGTASRGAQVLPFTATVTISGRNRGIPPSDPAQPSAHPICKQRIVSPIPIDLRPRDGGTLAILIDTASWFSAVDFTALPADGVLPDNNSNSASQNLFTGLRAAAATFQLSFR